MEFEGKTVLITGASVGIGYAAALKFAQGGANLVLFDINTDKLQSVKDKLLEYTLNIMIFGCDVSNASDVNSAISEAISAFGGIDILVNNAGIWRDMTPFEDVSADMWRKYIDINIMGAVYCIKAVLPGMKKNHYGRIINVASVAGVYGNRNMAHYSATKGALIAMTKALAKEVAPQGISVNAVSPGSVSPSENDDVNSYISSPLSYSERTGTDAENAELICFLAGDKCPYINGQNIQIDGCRKLL